ncbi:MAG: hypothetical protein KAT43_03200 [Nanoarchaeota archaeon]|nr:hypothetical protein [Nanoarchaeota archaeon]
MRKVNPNRINRILRIYEEPYRFLKDAEVEYPAVSGKFFVEETNYAAAPIEHLTGIEAMFCINQVSYVAFCEWILESRFKNLQMDFDMFLHYMKEHMLIARTTTQIEFRKKIPTDNMINATGELKAARTNGDLWVAVMNYDFEEGRAKASLTLALER